MLQNNKDIEKVIIEDLVKKEKIYWKIKIFGTKGWKKELDIYCNRGFRKL